MSRFIDGRHLRTARIMAGLSQAELATAAGLHANSVKYHEKNREHGPAGWAVEQMAAALAAHGVIAGTTYKGYRQSAFVRLG
jgi:DNA-binding XRE family transcriptional regulator